MDKMDPFPYRTLCETYFRFIRFYAQSIFFLLLQHHMPLMQCELGTCTNLVALSSRYAPEKSAATSRVMPQVDGHEKNTGEHILFYNNLIQFSTMRNYRHYY